MDKQTLTRKDRIFVSWSFRGLYFASFYVYVTYEIDAWMRFSPSVGETILRAVPDPSRMETLEVEARFFWDSFLFEGRKLPKWMHRFVKPTPQQVIQSTRQAFQSGKLHEEFGMQQAPVGELEEVLQTAMRIA